MKDIIIINNKSYRFKDIGFKWVPVHKLTIVQGALYHKYNDKVLIIFLFSFWAGRFLNINDYTFSNIFNNEAIQEVDKFENDSKLISNHMKKIESIDLEKEKEDIKLFNIGDYFFWSIVIIPIGIIIYLM
jgi:hypothetical protein